ncbi:MAG: hypothetical protein WBA46_05850 [Thermomicrobiales bacterium]
MVAVSPVQLDPSEFKTFLSPGQRFVASDLITERGTGEVTVARLVYDRYGFLHVTLRTDDGREISAFAEQIEVAIEEGHLSPIGAPVLLTVC